MRITEEQITDALRSLKEDTSDERFLILTSETPKRRRLRPLVWYGAAASVAILIGIASILSLMTDDRNDVIPTASTTVIDDDLSLLVSQSLEAQTEAQEQRTRTSDLVSEHQSLVLQH